VSELRGTTKPFTTLQAAVARNMNESLKVRRLQELAVVLAGSSLQPSSSSWAVLQRQQSAGRKEQLLCPTWHNAELKLQKRHQQCRNHYTAGYACSCPC
jgi:hypothetical protein